MEQDIKVTKMFFKGNQLFCLFWIIILTEKWHLQLLPLPNLYFSKLAPAKWIVETSFTAFAALSTSRKPSTLSSDVAVLLPLRTLSTASFARSPPSHAEARGVLSGGLAWRLWRDAGGRQELPGHFHVCGLGHR